MNGEDLSSLKITDIDSILSHISSRHESGLKATQIGSDVLIVVAPPAQDLSVTDSNRSATMAELRWSTPDAVETKGTANLLDVATSAFQHMLNAHEDQSIVVRYVSILTATTQYLIMYIHMKTEETLGLARQMPANSLFSNSLLSLKIPKRTPKSSREP